ncbi:MAG: prolyl oligopeptidase family serine peptidase [Acidobacteria bacterium]|nr:prolyl oligopeptidase family serine peptidase [Acidobacteriota bacterium]
MSLHFALAGQGLAEPGQAGFLNRTLRWGTGDYRYQVYLPAGFTPERRWPVVLFLHGAGERGSDGMRQTEVGLGRAIRMNRDRFPAVGVFPQAPKDGAWVGDTARMALLALDRAVAEFNGDPQRLYLTGISLGGYGTWQIASENPERFAAIVPICGGVVAPPGMPALREIQIPETLDAADPYLAVASRVKTLPAWVFHGAADPRVPVSESRRMVEALRRLGADVRYTEYEGVGHNSWDRAYAEADLWTWLFVQRRAAASSR